jgi:hypothetical protein
MALVPDQAPDATHAVAFVELQLSVELAPVPTVLGDAPRLTVGDGAVIDTIVDWVACPCAPVQVNVKVELADSEPLDCEPLVAFLPDHAPEATHQSASSVDQVRVEAPPGLTVVGVAVSTITGARPDTETVVDCVTDPAAPVHTSSYSVVLESFPVDQVPLVAKGPCHPPDPVHAVAFCAFHVRVEMPFLGTVVGAAVRVRVGNAEAVVDPPTLGVDASIASLLSALFAADCPQAASAATSVHTASPRQRRAPDERREPPLLDEEIISRLIGDFARACRVSKAIASLGSGTAPHALVDLCDYEARMIHGISTLANLSPNANALAFHLSQFGNGSTLARDMPC